MEQQSRGSVDLSNFDHMNSSHKGQLFSSPQADNPIELITSGKKGDSNEERHLLALHISCDTDSG
jgi:hypothetical protein